MVVMLRKVATNHSRFKSRKSRIDIDVENAFACMKAAYDAGVNFFDCAEAYSKGKSEESVGRCIKKYGSVCHDLAWYVD